MYKFKEYVTHTSETVQVTKSDGSKDYDVLDSYVTRSIEEEGSPFEGEKLATNAFIMRVMGHLLGKVLTTIEATTANEKQAKAIKDLMRGHFSEEMDFVGSILFDQKELDESATEAFDNGEIMAPVAIDEVLGLDKKD